jgi:hypothetical protein
MDLKQIGCEGLEWNELAWDRFQWLTLFKALINIYIPKSRDFFEHVNNFKDLKKKYALLS